MAGGTPPRRILSYPWMMLFAQPVHRIENKTKELNRTWNLIPILKMILHNTSSSSPLMSNALWYGFCLFGSTRHSLQWARSPLSKLSDKAIFLSTWQLKSTARNLKSLQECRWITLLSIAMETISKSRKTTGNRNTVWFNDECKDAINQRKRALKRVSSLPTVENVENRRVMRASARRTIRRVHRQSSQQFLSSVNSRTPLKKVWNLVNKITWKRSPAEVHQLVVDDNEISSVEHIADTLAKTFSENSSDKHYSDTFQIYKEQAEQQQIKFNSNNKENYNLLFSMDELLDAIGKSHDSAVSLDDIHYQMIKHLSSGAQHILLDVLNDIWTNGNLPWEKQVN